MCGHDSPAGSSFCLNCGSSLAPNASAPHAFAQTPGSPPGLPTICGACRGENPPGMKFCRSCGGALSASAAPPYGAPVLGPPPGPAYGAPPPAFGAPGMAPPPAYGAPGMGAPGMGAPGMGAPGMGHGGLGAGMAATMAAPSTSGPAPLPPPPSTNPVGSPSGPRVVVGAAQDNMITCPRCGTPTPLGFAYCQQCGLHMQALQPTDPGASARPRSPSSSGAAGSSGSGGPIPGGTTPGGRPPGGGVNLHAPIDPQGATLASEGARAMAPPSSRPAPVAMSTPAAATGPAWGTAILVNRDGTDGQRFPLAGEYSVIGRAGADIAFEDDRFLARQHARFERTGDGSVRIHPLDTLNGVFRKADVPVDLVDGMTILVGREVLRYEKVDSEETKVHPLIRHGVALFGSPPREPWGRFLQIVPSGGYRDVRHLAGDEVVLGREEGDIVFRDDAFMSRRHAAVTWDGKKAQITDLGSSNGTFVRVTAATPVKHGDHLRMGDQLLRIELGT
ncbi:MAG: FHA domain-containing protein [Deltaproteobacteria bacterium]|nr:FHA domain-containing protein [Deltaproteobacteria bacterium]